MSTEQLIPAASHTIVNGCSAASTDEFALNAIDSLCLDTFFLGQPLLKAAQL